MAPREAVPRKAPNDKETRAGNWVLGCY